jgi:hypothetical protein
MGGRRPGSAPAVAELAGRVLDDVIGVSRFPFPEVEAATGAGFA